MLPPPSVADARFVPISGRRRTSALAGPVVLALARGIAGARWRGTALGLSPLDQAILGQLLQGLKPRAALVIGAADGSGDGDARWLADQAAALGLDCRVHTVGTVGAAAAGAGTDPGSPVVVHDRDPSAIAEVVSPFELARWPLPRLVLVSAGCAGDLVRLLDYLHFHALRPGDYLVVGDTNPEAPRALDVSVADPAVAYRPIGPGRLDRLDRFFAAHGEVYRVDRGCCDAFGYNATWHWNGYLVRV